MPFWKCFPCMRFQCDEVITKLDYSNCALTDVPPDVSQHERTLEELYLSSNRIRTVCPQLFYCQGIRVLFVNDNDLESLPNAIGSLRQLQNLNLSRNGLSTVPDNIKSCKNLTRLDLSLNNLQRLPNAITSLISLQELLLNETNLEFLPANFGRLVHLRILELRSNNLITLPKSMSRLSNLNRIDIGANEFTELPEVICQLPQLRELWIDVNRIRRISPNISNLRELKHFEANNNLLLTLPNEISNWRNLEVLSISTNDIESLPFSIGMLKNLVTFQCEANQLRELPDSICHLENLEEMVISHNFILRLPSTIGMLRKLRFFSADENILRSLPVEICSCTSLAVLSVRSNKITELPHNIGHLVNLRVLNLVDNYFTYLPVSVLSLTKLTALWISDNQSQPLVPLQYANASNKTCLTCFMLPQQALPPEEADQSNEYNDRGLNNAWLNQQKQEKPTGILAFGKKGILHPSQKNLFADDKSDSTFVIHESSVTNQSQGIFFAEGETSKEHTFTKQSDSAMSPSRRICFADEVKGAEILATRLMRSPTPYPKELRLMAKYVRNNHQSQAQDLHFNSHQELVDEAEQAQRLISLPSNSDKIDGENYLSRASPTTVNPASKNGVKEARVVFNTGENSVLLQQVQNSAIFNRNRSINVDLGELPANNLINQISEHNAQYINRQQQVQSFPENNNAIMKSNTNNDMNLSQQQTTMQTSSADTNGESTRYANQASLVAQQQQQYNQYYRNSLRQSATPTQLDFSEQYYLHPPLLYDQQMRETLYEGSGSVRQISSSSSIISSYSQQGSQQIPNNAYSIQNNKPPPYHIARAFTKKSREDLLNYDTVRYKIHHSGEAQYDADGFVGAELEEQEKTEEYQEDNKSLENIPREYSALNDHHSQISRHRNNSIHSLNDNEYDLIDHHNNNNSKLKPTYSLECENGLIKHHSMLSLQDVHNVPDVSDHATHLDIYSSSIQRQQWNGILNGDVNGTIANTSDALQEVKTNSNSNPWRTPSRSSAWLFGLHKNPTVKQVAIKRDSQIGFDIQERPNEGIFVRGTHPNTSAAALLHANDKLLEVDGYDFTKICLVDAQQILDNSGPVINVMISRT